MAKKSKGWLKGCAIGCGVLVLIPVLIVLAVSVRTCVPLRTASRDLGRLEEKFGPPGAFAPPADGAIPDPRIGAFLEVRQAMMAPCERFQGLWEKMERVEQLDEAESLSGREVADTTKALGGAAAEIAPFVGEFFEQRNRSLLEAEMGLGEYSYIFVLAYHEQLLDRTIHRELFTEGGLFSPEAQATLRTILTHQLDQLTTDRVDDDLRRQLEREIDAMEQDPQRVPWQDGLPTPIESALEPHREQLDDSFCKATAGIALDHSSRRALIIALY